MVSSSFLLSAQPESDISLAAMGLVDDILQGLPVNSILREKVGQLNAEKAAVDEENAILKDDNRELKAEIAKLKNQVRELTHDDLGEVERELIRLVATNEDADDAAEVYAPQLNLTPKQVEIYLGSLCDQEYLSYFATYYSLTDKGRAYVLKNKLF
jgi:hypothetical protein